MKGRILLLTATTMLCTGMSPALADEAALKAEVADLKARLQRLEGLLEKVETRAAAAEQSAAKAEVAATEVKASSVTGNGSLDNVNVSWSNGAPKIETADGAHSFKPVGRAAFDYTYFRDDERDMPSGADVRRIWVGAEGQVAYDWKWKFLYDLSNDSIQDALISYEGIENVSITAGNQNELSSLEQQTGNLHQAFLENSLIHSAFFPGRNLGVTGKVSGDNWSIAAGAFGEGESDDRNGPGNEDHAFGARATFAPVNDKETVIHTGLSARHFKPTDDEIRFRSRPESNQSNNFWQVDTGDITDADNAQTYGAELAMNYKNFNAQAEYMRTDVERSVGTDPAFDGFYVQGSWFLTGENRSYSGANGAFGRVKPANPLSKGGPGAWEAAVRYSTIDLTDAGISGGEADNITLGLNWYPEGNIKFQLNYVMTDTDDSALGGGAAPDDDPHIVALRAQYDF